MKARMNNNIDQLIHYIENTPTIRVCLKSRLG